MYRSSFERLVQAARDCPLVIFLTPVLFGTFSSTIKNVIERGDLVIPQFSTCRQVVIGYGEECRRLCECLGRLMEQGRAA